MKNFDLNIENVLFLNWNFVSTIMIYIYNIFIDFSNTLNILHQNVYYV